MSYLITILFTLVSIQSRGSDLCAEVNQSKLKTPQGKPVMWVDRGPIDQLDLFWGGSAPHRAPIGPLYFDKNKTSGVNPGLKARDANCVKWGLKFNGSKGSEVHSEIAATRLAWAVGLNVQESYYLDHAQIVFSTEEPKKGQTDRRYEALAQGVKSFVDKDGKIQGHPIRLEREDLDEVEYDQTWFYDKNPIKDNPETAKHFSAQVVFNVLIGNWDLGKSIEKSNNKIIGRPNPNGEIEDWYLVSDYGGSFGEIGKRMLLKRGHSKYDLKGFELKSNGGKNDPPVSHIKDGKVFFNFDGEIISGHIKNLQEVPLEHARWFADIIAPLKESQIQDAFRAAGATQVEIEGFARILKSRIDQFVGCVQAPETCQP